MLSIDLIHRGGFMMWPLAISGLVALTLIFARLYFLFWNYNFATQEDMLRLKSASDLSLLSEKLHSPPQIALLKKAQLNWHSSNDEFLLQMQQESQLWADRFHMGLGGLDTIITAAPLMGLLGTITGMMGSFKALSNQAGPDTLAITGGISEALIATATGLVVALISLFAHNFFLARAEKLSTELEMFAGNLIQAQKLQFEK